MLTHWVKRSSPPPSWSAIVRALESPAIARGDIAATIKVGNYITIESFILYKFLQYMFYPLRYKHK